MITFIESGNRIATENFETGEIYTITFTSGNYKTMCCIGIGTDFVMFQGTSPNALFCLTLGTSETVTTIELGGGGSVTMNYNELENKPQINGIVLVGNKTAADLNLASTTDLNGKQDTLTTPQLTAVNSGITSADVTQITTNKNNISSLFLSDTGKTGDLNDVTANEFTVYTPESTHLPTADYYFVRTSTNSSANARLQEAFEMVAGDAYVRVFDGYIWSAWLKITNPTT